MESVYLKQLVNTKPQGGSLDTNAPFSFLEWKERLPSIVERDAVFHYNNYVLQWFANNKEKTVSQEFVLRQKYLYLLDQLQLFFSEEEKNTWYSQVNLADEKELLLAIPYFARKLKDVALYYLKLRKQLKNTKLKYNTVGTTTGLEQELYSYLLDTFSSSNTELTPSLYTTVPSFSALQKSLVVQVEELYDDKQYFDLSPTKPLSGYFNLLDQATSNFLGTKGIVLSSSEWLFESFNIPLSSNFDTFISELTGNIFELSDAELYNNFVQKYIAETKYAVTFASDLSAISTTDITITKGNNYFYYPYGTTDMSVAIPEQIAIVSLSSITIGSATGGSSIQTADTMFVKNGDEVKGAWLRYQEFEESSKTVKAILKKDSSTGFIYPFPGYGLSGQNVPWTDSGFETTIEYDFLSKDAKASVNQAYWSQTLPPKDSCETLLLNNTTLVSSGATSSNAPQHADHFFVRLERNANTMTPFGELSGAWLYKFTKTCIPISINGTNVFAWPYSILDLEEAYPDSLNQLSFAEACNPIPVQQIANSSFIAASSFELADKLYKLSNFKDNTEDALECTWLSGAAVNANGYQYIKQDSFSVLFSTGEATRFVWTGPETSLDSIFKDVDHRKDCPFVTNSPTVSAFEWQKCTCKQVYHTPFGHPGKSFEEGNSFADCIAKVTENNLNPFDFSSWRDSTNNPVFSSLEFAWYQTNTNHSWGDGQWVSNIFPSAPFNLETGKCYFYKRASAKNSTEGMPSYSVNRSFNTNHTKWVASKLTPEGDWKSADVDSTFVFYPGDFIKCDRQTQTTSYLISSYETENTSTNKKSVWSTYDAIPVVCDKNNSTTITWPTQTAPFGSTDSQYPSVLLEQVRSIYGWTITRDEDGESHTMLGQTMVTFVPPTTGTYSVSVTANVVPLSSLSVTFPTTTADSTQTYILDSSVIPKISAFAPYATEYVELEFSTPSSGFLLEQSLNGWNYNTNKIDSNASGARPYWAELDTTKTTTTRYKGIYSWGYPDVYVDEYLPNYNPIVSHIEIKFGTIIEYVHRGYSIVWNQPITYKEYVGTSKWCTIYSDVTQSSNLSALYKSKQNPEPIVIPTIIPTDIQLTNTLNGAPVEIFYYALNSFVWPVSVTLIQSTTVPTPSAYFEAQVPWTTLTNRFYPTIANVPVTEETYSIEDVGGYFLPQNLGASLFLNKNFESSFKTTDLSGTFLTEDNNIHIGGRGRTKEDQNSLYDWTENNQWLKESATTGDLAGSVKKTLTKTLQTFIPYQSNIEETALGLVTPRSRLSPWGGLNDEEWTDVANEPKGFTGVRNVSAWAASQVLKQHEKDVDRWTSDIYGNQYGLFKQLSGISVSDYINSPGELWVKTNDQIVDPAYVALSAMFSPFKTINLTVYNEITGNGVEYVDCYFDTLFIETSSSVIFAKIDYNFDTATIESTFDDTRYKLLSSNLRFDRNWFFPTEKRVVSLFTEITGNYFSPALYELDLPTRKYKKIFPLDSTNTTNLTSGIDGLNFTYLSRGSFHYNSTLNTFLITYTGTDSDEKMFIADFLIKYEDQINLIKTNLYLDFFNTNAVNEPPIVTSNYLSAINVGITPFVISVSAINDPTSYLLLNYTTEITADNFGTFTGILSSGLHHINYMVSNNIGDSIYCLTLSAL